MDDFNGHFYILEWKEQIVRLQLLEYLLEANNKEMWKRFRWMNTLHSNCHYMSNCPHGMILEPI